MNFISLALIFLQLICCFAQEITDDNAPQDGPFMSEKSELFRFSRDAKATWFSKYKENQQQQQQQQLVNHEDQQQEQQVEVKHGPQTPVQAPTFSDSSSGTSDNSVVQQRESVVEETQQQQQIEQPEQQQLVQQPQQTPEISLPVSHSQAPKTTTYLHLPSYPTSRLVSYAPRYNFPLTKSKSPTSKTVTTTTTTTTTRQNNQQPAQVAVIRQVRVHTVPLSEPAHYVIAPSYGATKAAHFEEASSASGSSHRSSSHSSSSSSTSTREEVESVAAPALQTVILPPPPSEIHVSHSRVVETIEPQTVVEPVCCFVKRPAPVLASKLVVETVPVDDGHHNEEHYHSVSRNLHEQSHGFGGLSASSSSSSSSSSASSSRSSKTISTGHHQTATLLAPPTVTVVHQPVTRVVSVKTAPLVFSEPLSTSVSSGEHYSSVDVDHHYNGPNVRYGYSIKQQSREPGTKGLAIGQRVLYLK